MVITYDIAKCVRKTFSEKYYMALLVLVIYSIYITLIALKRTHCLYNDGINGPCLVKFNETKKFRLKISFSKKYEDNVIDNYLVSLNLSRFSNKK